MRVAAYVRVSTRDQSLDRQLASTHEYSQHEFDARPVETYRDKATGSDIDRDGFHDLLDDVQDGEYDAIVVHSISRLSRSIRDLDQTVETIVEESDTQLHIISEGMRITGDQDPYQTALLQLLGVFAELEANMTRQRVKEGIQMRMENEDFRDDETRRVSNHSTPRYFTGRSLDLDLQSRPEQAQIRRLMRYRAVKLWLGT